MIRSALPEDASRLAEILVFTKRTSYRDIFHDDIGSFNEMQVLDLALNYRQEQSALNHVYVYDDGVVKGMMHCAPPPHGEKGCCWELKELYVEPFFQGQKIGKKLLLEFIQMAKSDLAEEAMLWVLEKNASAICFYESFGFKYNGERKLEEGTSEYIVKYVNRL